MSVRLKRLHLAIDSALVTRKGVNFRLPSWPPPKDFPVLVDANGHVVSRYGDTSWNLTLWSKRSCKLNFGDGPQRKGSRSISPENSNLLRQISAWWLWGPKAVQNPRTLERRFALLRPIFILCSEEGILASDLTRYPAVAEKLAGVLAPSGADYVVFLLRQIFDERGALGFTLLDTRGLRHLGATLPDHVRRQRPYIPPRIWKYQLDRLRAFLDDFLLHQEKIEACYLFCFEAYSRNYGSAAAACHGNRNLSRRPFGRAVRAWNGAKTGGEHIGPFSATAERFGIDGVLRRWCLPSRADLDQGGRGVSTLATYFCMAERVGIAYLLSLSMMRIEEAWSLRANCIEVEHDNRIGDIYMLRGVTTKTVEDDDARWVTPPSVKIAVNVMSCVSKLRMIAAKANPDSPITFDFLHNPYLALRSYEPWSRSERSKYPLHVRPIYPSYRDVIRDHPNLFDLDELRITNEDLHVARLITPSLDDQKFAVGNVWPLTWHQLRRTGAVNMQASGLVSDSTLQYQLKHTSRVMSLYYGQGYSKVRINDSLRNEYISTVFEVLGKEIAGLFSERYVSPHGEERKARMLSMIVDSSDSETLSELARKGRVAWRETLLGGCTRRGPCTYGGIDNVVRCAGGDSHAACVDALFDREKIPAIRQLSRVIAARLIESPVDSPYRASLEAQQRAVENALDALAT